MAWSPSPQEIITVWRSNPTARSWLGGQTSSAQSTVPGGLNGVIAHRRGTSSHSLALKSDGTVVAWGHNDLRPKHGAGRIEWRCRHRRRTRSQSGAQIRRHGRGLGENDYGQSTVPDGLNGAVAIAAASLSQSGPQIRRHGRALGEYKPARRAD